LALSFTGGLNKKSKSVVKYQFIKAF